jgi:hypothetical protein
MQLLAAVEADSATPLVETLIASIGRLRRGMTAVIITASVDPTWVRPVAALRARGIGCVVVTLDAPSYARAEAAARADTTGTEVTPDPDRDATDAQRARALRHALAEYELKAFEIPPGRPLGEVLAG